MATATKTAAGHKAARKTPARQSTKTPAAQRAKAAEPAAKALPSPPLAKGAKPPKAMKADKPAKGAEKARKPKLVRDSFTIPKAEYEVIAALKLRAAKLGQTPKKSELLRAGIKLLAGLGDQALLASLSAVPSIKTGRPAA